MSHEQSETIQRKDGKWINVYGKKTKSAGRKLPGSGVFDSSKEAVKAAKSRSERTVTIGASPKTPKKRSMDTSRRRQKK